MMPKWFMTWANDVLGFVALFFSDEIGTVDATTTSLGVL
jgi:hypothetical protein